MLNLESSNMPVVEWEGDITQDHQATILVNPVNCVGVMGAGLAKQLRILYPSHFNEYKKLCVNNAVRLGEVIIISSGETQPEFIALFPTKQHWKDHSDIWYVDQGIIALRNMLVTKIPESWIVAMPAVGCGLGGLSYEDVLQSTQVFMKDVKQEVRFYKQWKEI